jgi:AcrR family transcriptional regulator
MADGRRALLDAARVEFAARGYAATSVRDILARAGLTPPALYHHFGSKAGLYAAVAAEINEMAIAGFDRAAARHSRFADRLIAALEASRSVQRNEPSIALFLLSSPQDVTRHVELARLGPPVQPLAEFAQRIAADGRPPALSQKQAADLALTLILGLSRMAALQTPREYSASVEAATTMIRRGLM